MIKSFKCIDTQKLFETGKSVRFAAVAKVATRKLTQLEVATTLEFMRSPPGNRLEKLVGNRDGQYSIRINDKWRLCFKWTAAGPEDVEITDYH
jgi:proteic killer suppression protein